MKLGLAAQPIPTPEARGFSKKILSFSPSCLEAQAAAENKIKRYYGVIRGWKSGVLAKTEKNWPEEVVKTVQIPAGSIQKASSLIDCLRMVSAGKRSKAGCWTVVSP